MNSGSENVAVGAPAGETEATSPKRDAWANRLLGTPLALTAALLATFTLFLPVLHYSFAPLDDASNIMANPYLSNPAAQDLGYFFFHPFYFVYMPITFVVWGLCARIAPLSAAQEMPLVHSVTYLNPMSFHAASLIFHLANAALVFAILRRFRFLPWACAAGAFVFAAHPVQVEAVAWITGANNLTAGFFGLASIYLYILGLPDDPRHGAKPATTRDRLYFVFATAAFLCALLSKPAAAAVPLSVAAIEWAVYRRPWRRWAGQMFVWCLLSLGCALVSRAATASSTDSVWSPLWGRPFIAGDALAFYLARLAAPIVTLNFARPPQLVLHQFWGYADWLAPAILFVALWCWPFGRNTVISSTTRADEPCWLRASVLLFVAGLIATIGLVPFYSEWNSTVADRYLYFAMLGPAVLVAYLLSSPALSVNARVIAALVTSLVLGALTALQLPVWRSPFSFVEYTATIEPGSPMINGLTGDVLYYHGDYQQALQQYQIAEKLWGTETVVNNRKIANCLMQLGRFDEAVKPVANIVLATPADNSAWLQLWSLLPHVQHSERLETIMRQRLGRNPSDGRSAFTLGAILFYRGQAAEALPILNFAVQSSADFSGMQFNFGVILERMNRIPEAEAQYERTLSLNPQNKQAAAALSELRSIRLDQSKNQINANPGSVESLPSSGLPILSPSP